MIKQLESLRGFAALSVAIYHFQISDLFKAPFFLNAFLMVDFFFVLSGFVIFYAYHKRVIDYKSGYIFQKRRFLRLYPLHILTLTLFLTIEIMKYAFSFEFQEMAFEKNTFVALIANIAILQNFVLPYNTFNNPSWSISAEFWVYISFIFTSLMYCKFRITTVVILCALLIFIAGFFTISRYELPGNITGPLRCFFGFYIGVVMCYLFKKYKLKNKFQTSAYSFIALATTVYLVPYFGSLNNLLPYTISIIFGLSILVISATSEDTYIVKCLNNYIFVYLGTISYGIYMIHFLVWLIIDNIASKVFHINLSDIGNLSSMLSDFVMIFGLLITIFLAHLSYKYFEVKFIDR